MGTPIDDAELVRRFTYHPPKDDQLPRYRAIRDKALEMARLIVKSSRSCREQSVALTHLDAVVHNANAAIARREAE